jgi:hypothetical protein
MFADRPKNLKEWYRLKTGVCTLPVESVIGTPPSKMMLPFEYV